MELKEGDVVEIVKYGSLAWIHKDEFKRRIEAGIFRKNTTEPNNCLGFDKSMNSFVYDTSPLLVGQIGIITKIEEVQGKKQYSLRGPSKVAWYFEDQLKLIK